MAHVVASQADLHRPYGGVVPEVASRRHLELIGPVVEETLEKAGRGVADLDGVAVTRGPGLLGALIVGVTYAKGLALSRRLPLVGVNHILAHVHAAFLGREPEFPLLALVVSGGHTDLIRFRGPLEVEVVGRSLDDAAGEAFDKVARLLGLPYPGGPHLEALAREGTPGRLRLPPVRLGPERSLAFSFSGLKTAASRLLTEGGKREDVALAFEEAAVGQLIEVTARALKEDDRMLVVAGGVSANTVLRTRMAEALPGREVVFPPRGLSTDNGAMVARLGWERLRSGERDELDLEPLPIIHPFR